MLGVVVLWLRYVALAVKGDITGIEKHCVRGKEKETAFITDLFPKDAIVEAVPPCCSVRVRDRFKHLVGEHVIRGVGELAIRSSRPRTATKVVLEGFDAYRTCPMSLKSVLL